MVAPADVGIAVSGWSGPGDASLGRARSRPADVVSRGGTAPSGESDADFPSECQHAVAADGLRIAGTHAGSGGGDVRAAPLAVPDQGGGDPAAAGAVPASASRARPG